MSRRSRLFLIVAAFVFLSLGCGAPKARISGVVTYKGNPVPGGTVVFRPKGGAGLYSCAIAPDGAYSGTDLPVGDMAVTIETDSVNPENVKQQVYQDKKREGNVMEMGPVPKGVSKSETRYVRIPGKYASAETSGLTVVLKRGEQKQDFPLTD